MTKIVQASPYELSAVMVLLNCMQEDLEVMKTPIDPVKAAYHILEVIVKGCCLLALHNDELAGSIGLRITTNWWSSEEPYAEDDWFYVHPDYRNTDAGKLLLEEAKRICDTDGIPFATGHQLSQQSRIPVKDRFYRNQGFTKIGSLFVYP